MRETGKAKEKERRDVTRRGRKTKRTRGQMARLYRKEKLGEGKQSSRAGDF